MLPLMVIGGIIGAVVSGIQGASWLSDQLDSARGVSAGGKVEVKPQTDAQASPFEATLAAQAAGQTLPASVGTATPAATPTLSTAMVPVTHTTDYDTLARVKAGITAYSHVGERHGNHAGAAKPPGSDATVPLTAS